MYTEVDDELHPAVRSDELMRALAPVVAPWSALCRCPTDEPGDRLTCPVVCAISMTMRNRPRGIPSPCWRARLLYASRYPGRLSPSLQIAKCRRVEVLTPANFQ